MAYQEHMKTFTIDKKRIILNHRKN